MPQIVMQIQKENEGHKSTKKDQKEKICSIINQVVVIRSRKTSKNSVQDPSTPKIKPVAKEGKKYSPLREMMKIRNLQHERLKKYKRDKFKTEKMDVRVSGEYSKTSFTKSDQVCKEKITHKDRKGILRNNVKENTENITPKIKISENGSFPETSKIVDVKKKKVKFADQYDYNGRLIRTPTNCNENGKVTKKSKFFKETHNNVTKITEQVCQEHCSSKTILNLTIFDKNFKGVPTGQHKTSLNCNEHGKVNKNSEFLKEAYKNIEKITEQVIRKSQENVSRFDEHFEDLSAGQLDLVEEFDLTQSFLSELPVDFPSFIERILIDNDRDYLMDILKFLNCKKSMVELRRKSGNTEPFYCEEENCLAEDNHKEPDCYFECENFIRTNFSFPIVAFGCISVFCVLFSNACRVW